jgi:D-arabinose 1-dehydrogenase-like Zn-dependent alcohol dehydrogenase
MKGTIAFIPSAHQIEFHEYEVPTPPPGGLLAEVTQTNVCGSEVHIWRGEFGGRHGTMPGHEMSGRVLALGGGVQSDWAGIAVRLHLRDALSGSPQPGLLSSTRQCA